MPKHKHMMPRLSPVVRDACMLYAKEQGENFHLNVDYEKLQRPIHVLAVQGVCEFAGHQWRQKQALVEHLKSKGLSVTGRTQEA